VRPEQSPGSDTVARGPGARREVTGCGAGQPVLLRSRTAPAGPWARGGGPPAFRPCGVCAPPACGRAVCGPRASGRAVRTGRRPALAGCCPTG